jgi:hypothetical protein
VEGVIRSKSSEEEGGGGGRDGGMVECAGIRGERERGRERAGRREGERVVGSQHAAYCGCANSVRERGRRGEGRGRRGEGRGNATP